MQSRLVLVVPFQQSRSLRTETTPLCFYRLPLAVFSCASANSESNRTTFIKEKRKPTTDIYRTKNLSGNCTLTSQSIEKHLSPEEKMVLLESGPTRGSRGSRKDLRQLSLLPAWQFYHISKPNTEEINHTGLLAYQ